MYRKMKRKIFEIIQPAADGNLASRLFDAFIMVVIGLSVVIVFISTFELPENVMDRFIKLELIIVAIFSVEYFLRVWTADLLYPDLTPFKARLRYIKSGMAIIDLLAILPFYLPFLLPSSMISLRMLRLVRLLRIFKLNRYTDALIGIGLVFKSKGRQLIASTIFVTILMVVSSMLIYNAEHEAQPELFKNAFSGIWWAVATLTTVGYGDIYPITAFRKILGALIAILGIGMVAIPTGILSAGFMEHLSEHDEKEEEGNYCPHCGKKLK